MPARTTRPRPRSAVPDAATPTVAEPTGPVFAPGAHEGEQASSEPRPAEPAPAAAGAPAPQPSGFRGLKVWQRAMELSVAVHQLTQALPKGEQDVLATELRRTSLQIPSYVAAGNSLFQRAEYVQYLSAAHGAVARLESALMLAERLGYVEARDAGALVAHATNVGYLLRALTRALQPPPDGDGAPPRATHRPAAAPSPPPAVD